jgi:hypothetical protein
MWLIIIIAVFALLCALVVWQHVRSVVSLERRLETQWGRVVDVFQPRLNSLEEVRRETQDEETLNILGRVKNAYIFALKNRDPENLAAADQVTREKLIPAAKREVSVKTYNSIASRYSRDYGQQVSRTVSTYNLKVLEYYQFAATYHKAMSILRRPRPEWVRIPGYDGENEVK